MIGLLIGFVAGLFVAGLCGLALWIGVVVGASSNSVDRIDRERAIYDLGREDAR